jgi:HD superfamily phosphohydrolase
MLYKDLIYRDVKIDEPVILDLINSRSVQRLRGIDQAGYKPMWVKPELKKDLYENSRLAHSIGVYLLLKKYDASPEEQIAGLIDYVLASGSEKEHTHQDDIFEDFVRKSEITKIIKSYGFDIDYILEDKNFPLKEKDLPDLCADRIDCSLRTAIFFEEIDKKGADYLLDNLVIQDRKWVFKNMESARSFSEMFLKLNVEYYAGFQSALMFRTVGDYLKYALEKGYVSEDDFYTIDAEVLTKIEKYHDKDEKLKLFFNRMNNKTKIINDPNNYDVKIYCKSRIVDPLLLQNGAVVRLSDIFNKWKYVVKKESVPKEYFLKFN